MCLRRPASQTEIQGVLSPFRAMIEGFWSISTTVVNDDITYPLINYLTYENPVRTRNVITVLTFQIPAPPGYVRLGPTRWNTLSLRLFKFFSDCIDFYGCEVERLKRLFHSEKGPSPYQALLPRFGHQISFFFL